MDPFEETPRHVASLLKVDLRVKLDNLIDSNKKASQAISNTRVQEIFDKLKGVNKSQQPSLQAATEKLDKYRNLLKELDAMNSDSGLGPMRKFHSNLFPH